jgi:hypothetical protein
LTFSHGYGSWFGQNTALAEELASRGFIVAGITHSHQSVFTAMDENEIYSFPEIVSLGEEDPDSLLIAEFERSFRLEDTSEFSDIFYQTPGKFACYQSICRDMGRRYSICAGPFIGAKCIR